VRLGLVVNPIAGMGGRVAFKGTDDPQLVAAARARGAQPVAPARAIEALRAIAAAGDGDLVLLSYPGEMGEREAREAGLDVRVLGTIGEVTTAADTRAAAAAMAAEGVELLVFAGGDGTAVDVLEAIGDRLPVIGIPAGVKMHSAVFAVNPRSAGEIAVRFAAASERGLRQAEVMDVDEALLREGAVSARLYGYLSVPAERRLLQGAKVRSLAGEQTAQAEIAHHLVDHVLGEATWFVGPGTTTKAVLDRLGLDKSLLGVDVVRGNTLLAADADEETLLELSQAGEVGIVVAPVGGQAFLFGRGNQQLSAAVIEGIGPEHVVVIATEAKIAALAGRPLRVDTGDPAVDAALAGYRRIVVGYHREIVYPVT
jgi:predicted polyphosphate/ATP-dependent NAD kinase